MKIPFHSSCACIGWQEVGWSGGIQMNMSIWNAMEQLGSTFRAVSQRGKSLSFESASDPSVCQTRGGNWHNSFRYVSASRSVEPRWGYISSKWLYLQTPSRMPYPLKPIDHWGDWHESSRVATTALSYIWLRFRLYLMSNILWELRKW